MVSVLGVSHYGDEKAVESRCVWEKYAAMVATACAEEMARRLGGDDGGSAPRRKRGRRSRIYVPPDGAVVAHTDASAESRRICVDPVG